MSDDIKPVLTAAERHTLLVRSNHPSIPDRLAYLVEITEQAVVQKLTARVAELEAHLRTIAKFGGTLDQARELAAKGLERAAQAAMASKCRT